MIAFLAPWIFGAAVGAALLTVAAHFLSVRRPPTVLLPTARFIAARDVRAVSRSARPSDLALLAVRVIALLLAGAAIAEPRATSSNRSTAHVIVADATWRADSARMRTLASSTADGPVSVVFADSGALRAELAAVWPVAWERTTALLSSDPSIDSVALDLFLPANSRSTAKRRPRARATC